MPTSWSSRRPGRARSPTAAEFADALAGKPVIAMANGLEKVGREFHPVLPAEGSISAEAVQAAAPAAHVVAAFHLVPAAALADLDAPARERRRSCAPTTTTPARSSVLDLVAGIPDLRAFDGGSLVNAIGIEAFAALLLTLQPPPQGQGHAAAARPRGLPAVTTGERPVTMRLFDTAHRKVVPFEPGPVVRMYVCGITPYDSTHLGHAATYLAYDLLIRRLEDLGHEVRMVRNVTDVDDSILPKARELGIPYLELADAELARFRSDMEALEMRPPVAEPRATEAIPGIVDMVEPAARLRARVPHRTAPSTSTCRRSPASASCRTTRPTTWCASPGRAAASPTTRTGATRSTSSSGSRRSPTSRRGARRSASAGPGWHVECSVMAMENLGQHARPARRRHRPDLPAPRVRDRAEREHHRASRSAATGCTRRWSATRARR